LRVKFYKFNSEGSLDPAMHLKNRINEIHQMAEAPTTSLFNFHFCLGVKGLFGWAKFPIFPNYQ
jgi:hypothetical protein